MQPQSCHQPFQWWEKQASRGFGENGITPSFDYFL